MKLTGVELRRITMPLVSPFRTSFGTQTSRDVLLLRVVTDEAEGWGECVAMADPLYSSEYAEAAAAVLRDHLIPALAAAAPGGAPGVAPALAPIKGHRMAKAALETAVLDAELRAEGRSFARELGAVHDRVMQVENRSIRRSEELDYPRGPILADHETSGPVRNAFA